MQRKKKTLNFNLAYRVSNAGCSHPLAHGDDDIADENGSATQSRLGGEPQVEPHRATETAVMQSRLVTSESAH